MKFFGTSASWIQQTLEISSQISDCISLHLYTASLLVVSMSQEKVQKWKFTFLYASFIRYEARNLYVILFKIYVNACVWYSTLTNCFMLQKLSFALITTLGSCYIILRNIKVEKEIYPDFAEMFSQTNGNK